MPTSSTSTKQSSNDNASMDFISQLVASGLSNGFESLKEKVSVSIKDNGEEYLTDALDKLKKAAVSLTEWSKKNPVKTAVAVAAVLAVTAFLVSTTKGGTASAKTAGKAASKTASKSTSSARTAASSTAARKTRSKSA